MLHSWQPTLFFKAENPLSLLRQLVAPCTRVGRKAKYGNTTHRTVLFLWMTFFLLGDVKRQMIRASW